MGDGRWEVGGKEVGGKEVGGGGISSVGFVRACQNEMAASHPHQHGG